MSDGPLAQYRDLAGRIVLITGGATGIGADMVRAFHGQGSHVTFADIDEAAGQALAAELSGSSFVRCDVTDTQALRDCIHGAGALDVLVNNAANDMRVALERIDEPMWERIVSVNLRHQFFAAQTAGAGMAARGRGAIINFGSVAPTLRIADLDAYSTCKTAVLGMTRQFARHFGHNGVRVNAIVPGAILTPRQLELWITPEDEARILADQCLHRRLVGSDVAEMALFLASDVSSACTGQEFVVDGGMT
ncbi:MAG: SDR family oxidoreductase [Pseudomonadota bacterium]